MNNGLGERTVWRRFEVKYLVTAVQAAELAQFCRRYLEPDRFAARTPDGIYPILSVYLDSPQRDLLRHTVEKRLHRFKLRIRTYRAPGARLGADAPAFLEIKRKDEGVSHKFRACIREVDPYAVIRDLRAGADWLDTVAQEQQRYAEEFRLLSSTLHAAPAVAVYYRREAYETAWGGRVRITLDRDVQAGLINAGADDAESWWPVIDGPRVIVEVKYDNACPFWLADMFRRLRVVSRSSSKYVRCVQFADQFRGTGGMRRIVG